MPVKVDAKLHYGKWHDIEVEDDVSAYVEYENGATGVFVTSTGDASGTNRFEIQMDGCQIIVENGKIILNEYENLITEHYKTATNLFAGPKITRIDPDLYYSELKKRIDSSRAKTNVKEQVADTSNTY